MLSNAMLFIWNGIM